MSEKISSEISKYQQALLFATKSHSTQMYDSDKPYLFHLNLVGIVLSRFGFDFIRNPNLHIAALLHDTLEDTKTSYNELKTMFGENVAEIVYSVTDGKGRNREERHRNTYPELANNLEAVVIKLADRIANVEYGIQTNNIKMFRKYRSEYGYFRETLRKEDHVPAMWKHLDNLFDWS